MTRDRQLFGYLNFHLHLATFLHICHPSSPLQPTIPSLFPYDSTTTRTSTSTSTVAPYDPIKDECFLNCTIHFTHRLESRFGANTRPQTEFYWKRLFTKGSTVENARIRFDGICHEYQRLRRCTRKCTKKQHSSANARSIEIFKENWGLIDLICVQKRKDFERNLPCFHEHQNRIHWDCMDQEVNAMNALKGFLEYNQAYRNESLEYLRLFCNETRSAIDCLVPKLMARCPAEAVDLMFDMLDITFQNFMLLFAQLKVQKQSLGSCELFLPAPNTSAGGGSPAGSTASRDRSSLASRLRHSWRTTQQQNITILKSQSLPTTTVRPKPNLRHKSNNHFKDLAEEQSSSRPEPIFVNGKRTRTGLEIRRHNKHHKDELNFPENEDDDDQGVHVKPHIKVSNSTKIHNNHISSSSSSANEQRLPRGGDDHGVIKNQPISAKNTALAISTEQHGLRNLYVFIISAAVYVSILY